MKHKQTKKPHPILRVLIAAVLISACGAVPEAMVSRLATQAAESLASNTTPTQAYTVQPGDTLSGIAVTFGTTVDTVIGLNAGAYPQMTDRRTLIAGWTIEVPTRAGARSVAAANDSAADAVAAQPTSAAPVRDANGGYFDYDAALEIIRLTNDERAKAGLGLLAVDETLMDVARKRAVEVVSIFSHAGLADDCWECGENASMGTGRTANFHFAGWMNSAGHRANILWPEHTAIGVGLYVLNNRSYAVQDFK